MRIISGSQKNKKILSPKGLSTRPTSSRLRETLFNVCQQEIEGALFLDLFAGSGAIGLEALSRGAESVTFLDQDKESIRCIQRNIKEMEFESHAKVLQGDAIVWLNRLSSFDYIYVDPPYTEKNREISYSSEVLKIIDERVMINPEGILFMEESHHWKPDVESLSRLELKKQRKVGRSLLYQFMLKGACESFISGDV